MINTWLIDLDGTLYKDTDCLYGRIYLFLANQFKISLEEATRLSNQYLELYGSTLSGLIKHHNSIDPEYYLHTVYKDASVSHIKPNMKLKNALSNINGKKIVFSNSTAKYAWRILDRLCVSSEVDDVCDIRMTQYHAKPKHIAFQHMVNSFDLVVNNTIMIDDRIKNLKQAKAEGMTTVLCSSEVVAERLCIFVDYQINSIETGIMELLDHVSIL
jgi:putative hydrolase of the HAD superfamily